MSRETTRNPIAWGLAALAALALSAACAREPEDASVATTAPDASATSSSAASAPRMIVHKTPTCGCCGLWVEHMQRAGLQVEVRDTDDLQSVKARLGVPYGKGSCHTAEVDGYLIEGHVPADDIRRLLAERPNARGLVLPRMPLGSPGMETPDGRVQPYTVELVADDGSTSAFRQHGSP